MRPMPGSETGAPLRGFAATPFSGHSPGNRERVPDGLDRVVEDRTAVDDLSVGDPRWVSKSSAGRAVVLRRFVGSGTGCRLVSPGIRGLPGTTTGNRREPGRFGARVGDSYSLQVQWRRPGPPSLRADRRTPPRHNPERMPARARLAQSVTTSSWSASRMW